MAADTFRVVYDVARDAGPFDMALVIGPILTAAGAVMALAPGFTQKVLPGGLQGAPRRAFGWVFFLFAASLTVAFYVGHFTTADRLAKARQSGDYDVTEGCLDAFHAMPAGGHDMERLHVGGRCFEYSDYAVSGSFRQTQSHGGPIHADSRVRLWSTGGRIIHAEVADNACRPAPDLHPDSCGKF